MLLLAIWFVAWVRSAFSLEGLRLALDIHSPSKVYAELGRSRMRHFWAGWDRAIAAAWVSARPAPAMSSAGGAGLKKGQRD
jgi:hypothetical protein